jgi:hypothetical protein
LAVLISVAVEVSTKKKSEPRKKRSAGSAGAIEGSAVEAMVVELSG